MEPFTEDTLVTALPCDSRHYFHKKCLEEWSRRSDVCPICRASYTIEEVKVFNESLNELEKRESLTNPGADIEMSKHTKVNIDSQQQREYPAS